MAETEHEQWDIVSSVGLTALVVAAGRAVDSHRPDALINDPYAELFVAAADPPTPLPVRPSTPKDDSEDEAWQMMSAYMGVRTKRFDDELLNSGASQVVILAAGLDCRALRLPWPEVTTVFEVDQPSVLEFKDWVLDENSAVPTSDRRVVPIDLRDDWRTALLGAGFDPTQRSAWLAEGLLPYLPAVAETALLQTVTDLAAPGSTFTIENFTNLSAQTSDPTFRRISERMGVDMASLLPEDDREDAGLWLARHGWQVESELAAHVAAEYGRELDPLTQRLNAKSEFVSARR